MDAGSETLSPITSSIIAELQNLQDLQLDLPNELSPDLAIFLQELKEISLWIIGSWIILLEKQDQSAATLVERLQRAQSESQVTAIFASTSPSPDENSVLTLPNYPPLHAKFITAVLRFIKSSHFKNLVTSNWTVSSKGENTISLDSQIVGYLSESNNLPSIFFSNSISTSPAETRFEEFLTTLKGDSEALQAAAFAINEAISAVALQIEDYIPAFSGGLYSNLLASISSKLSIMVAEHCGRPEQQVGMVA